MNKDLTGRVFGRLTVIRQLEKGQGYPLWLCKCQCGNEAKVMGHRLVSGTTKSCGCILREGVWDPEKHPELFEGTNVSKIANTKPKANNTSGVTGVVLTKNGMWQAHIGLQGKRIWLGTFAIFEEAVEARKKAEELYFKPIIEKFYKETGQNKKQK